MFKGEKRMKYEEIKKQIGLRLEEVEKITKEKTEKEAILREQIDEKLKLLVNGGYSKNESYMLLTGKACDWRTLKRWHSGELITIRSYQKLFTLIEE